MTTQVQLLPLGARITHFGGGPSTHGKGTIIAYNGVPGNSYIKDNLCKVLHDAEKAGLGGLVATAAVTSMYSGDRFPYVIQFDPAVGLNDHACELRLRYPRGYKDVYEPGSIQLIEPEENVFPNVSVRFVCRVWNNDDAEWSEWGEITALQYAEYRDSKQHQCIARF